MDRAVASELEGLDLDLGLLPRLHEADVLVFDESLHLHRIILRYDQHQGLGRGNDTASGVNGKLLNRPVHGCSISAKQAILRRAMRPVILILASAVAG